MENWDEVRTAFHVARSGTVSGAAEAMGVHHATVIRHIDALEQRLGAKLFQRHARGYTPTEAGQDLLQVAQATSDQFAQLSGRIKGQGDVMSGNLVVTSLPVMAPLFAPVLAQLQAAHPDLRIRYLTSEREFLLEYGEAHVAIRSGPEPKEPDNVVQRLGQTTMHLVAAESYLARYGMPKDATDLRQHLCVCIDRSASRAPFHGWFADMGLADRIVFRTDDTATMVDAIVGGAGIGFVDGWRMRRDGLVEVIPSQPAWDAPLWLVTHVDLHRSVKVQAVLIALKAAAKDFDK